MNKITKGAIAGSLIMFLAGSSAFAAATSTSTTTIKTTTTNGVTTTTTTTTTKSTETTTTTAKQDPVKKPTTTSTANKPNTYNGCTKKDHRDCKHNDNHYGNNRPSHPNEHKVVNCPHTKQCTSSKVCEQLKERSAKLPCNGKPNCQMHAGTYYDHKYHKVTEVKCTGKPGCPKHDAKAHAPKQPVPAEKPMKKLPAKKAVKA